MIQKPYVKKMVWLLGMLLIGALSSGLWEALLKPSLYWFGTVMLDVATLGLNSLRDGMYLEVAKGSYERAALSVLAVSLGFLAGMATAPLIVRKFLLRKSDQEPSKLAGIMRKHLVMWTMVIALPLFFALQLFRVSYVVRAANHAEQMQQIVAPYLKPEERLLFASRFAQVTTRQEYFELVSTLRKIAVAKGARIPEFDIY